MLAVISMFSQMLLCLIFLCCAGFCYAGPAQVTEATAGAEEPGTSSAQVVFTEAESTDCLLDEAKQVSLQLLDTSSDYEVWVDRWFLNVQTADHTKHRLTQAQSSVPLGCSKTYSGPQHWTIYSSKPIKN